MKTSFLGSQKENSRGDIVSFWFKPERPLDHLAGQFVSLTLDTQTNDERGLSRWFTISSPPNQSDFSITTRLSGANGSAFKANLRKLQPGAVVHISEPLGDFVLPKDAHIPLVFAAAGIGLTPFHAIIRDLQARQQHRTITLLIYARSETDLIWQTTFESYGLHPIIILSQPSVNWRGLSGRLSGERLIELSSPVAENLIYLSGPEAVVGDWSKQLQAAAIQPGHIVTDLFPGYID